MSTTLQVHAFGASDRGLRRSANEDAWLINPHHGLYAVADGMGGRKGGGVAARIAIHHVNRYLSGWWPEDQLSTAPNGVDPLVLLLARAVQAANDDIVRLKARNKPLRKMGTTLTSMMFSGHHALLCHVGDSRAYRIRGQRIEQLTEDHTVVNELVKSGRMTPAQAARSPYRSHLNRFLGRELGVPVDVQAVRAKPGDVFLLCSDGLCNLVDEQEILETVQNTPPAETTDRLIEIANGRGGYDNITVILLPIH